MHSTVNPSISVMKTYQLTLYKDKSRCMFRESFRIHNALSVLNVQFLVLNMVVCKVTTKLCVVKDKLHFFGYSVLAGSLATRNVYSYQSISQTEPRRLTSMFLCFGYFVPEFQEQLHAAWSPNLYTRITSKLISLGLLYQPVFCLC